MDIKKLTILFLGMLHLNLSYSQVDIQPATALLERVVPGHASEFVVERIDAKAGNDVFELESRNGKVVLRGNTGVAIASGLYYYLNNYCHCQITWNGVNMKVPKRLPPVKEKIRKETPYEYRYYLNYCTFNYSMSWWDWERWEKEIDWMALHGINMPLAITGEEYVWHEVYREMGFTDNELKDFFCGPSYFSWFWMGNLDGWGGPLPHSWMKSHYELQKKILKRQRALGMRPVLPAFTGHVPAAFKARYPDAKLKATNWNNGFADTYILNPEDPMFAEIAKRFLEKQTALYGTDHLYSADTFNENEPPSNDPAYLKALSARLYEGMRKVDTAAVWVMQGWLFYSDRRFWGEPQVKALLEAVPDDKMILLDLCTEIEPVWKRTNAFYGKHWIWNMLNNFGGNTNLFGRMETVAQAPAQTLNDPNSGKLKGIGLTMEAIEQNPVIYELMMDNTWRNKPIDISKWLSDYVRNRYGQTNLEALKAWEVLQNTAYKVPADRYKRDGAESVIQMRPGLDTATRWVRPQLNYDAAALLPAWDAMIKAADKLRVSDGFQFDLVDVTRQVLANYAFPLRESIISAIKDKDIVSFSKKSQEFIELIEDMDRILGTRKDFLLGRWIAEARGWGIDEKEKALYEMNAKDLITLWGDEKSPLNEYSCRQWSGLLNDFYKPRWQQFFAVAKRALEQHQPIDFKAFNTGIAKWEWEWVNARKDYSTVATGEPVTIAKSLYKKYRRKLTI